MIIPALSGMLYNYPLNLWITPDGSEQIRTKGSSCRDDLAWEQIAYATKKAIIADRLSTY